jgi:hypothetical protein
MAVSNRDRIGQMFDLMAPRLDDFLSQILDPQLEAGRTWVDIVTTVDNNNPRDVHRGDPSVQLKVVTQDYTHRYRRNWRPLGAPSEPHSSGLRCRTAAGAAHLGAHEVVHRR